MGQIHLISRLCSTSVILDNLISFLIFADRLKQNRKLYHKNKPLVALIHIRLKDKGELWGSGGWGGTFCKDVLTDAQEERYLSFV